jgi:hypothetical protein
VGSHTRVSLCNSSTTPTLPKFAWTMNRWAVEGSINDTYRFNPWRKPGAAPVFDACGKAGGTYPKNFGPGVATFANTSLAKGGDLGSQVLKPADDPVVWTAGSPAEVSWGIRYNHGGGCATLDSNLRQVTPSGPTRACTCATLIPILAPLASSAHRLAPRRGRPVQAVPAGGAAHRGVLPEDAP